MTRKRKVFLAVGAAVVAVVAVAYLLPASVEVERSVTIGAPAETIHATLAELATWPEWTAWDRKRDPTVRHHFFGPPSGVGAGYRWQGEEYGEGELTITGSDPSSGVEFDIELDGGRYRSSGSIRLAPGASGAGTEVTWTYAAELGRNPLGRYFGLLMDRMIGPDLEVGLARLKKRIESLPPSPEADPSQEDPLPADPESPAPAASRR